jgi:hypothetical protein
MSAFVTQDKDGLVTGVKNWNLYHACAKELKVWPDTNLLWDFPFNDLFQQCRDDILHQIDLGMMQHLQNALVSRYIMELHKVCQRFQRVLSLKPNRNWHQDHIEEII